MKKKGLLAKSLALVTSAAMVVGCVGCGSTAESSTSAESSTKTTETTTTTNAAEAQTEIVSEATDKVLKVATATLPETLDANASVSNAGIQVYYNIYDTLIMRDTSADEPTFLPGLAVRWEQVDDLVWEFKLRENVKFHDGTTMDAEDVCYFILSCILCGNKNFRRNQNK